MADEKADELGPGMGPAKAGGVYEDAPGAGTFHDAHGRAVDKNGKLLRGDEVPGAVNADDLDADWRKDMEKQRKASASASKEEMAAGRDQASEPAGEEEAVTRRGRR